MSSQGRDERIGDAEVQNVMGQRATFLPVGLVTKSMVYWKGAFDDEGGKEGYERRGQGISYLPLFPYMWAEGARRSASRMLGLCSLAEGKVPFRASEHF